MPRIVVIGDLHGKTDSYQKMLRQKYEGVRTVQVGDAGIGFPGVGLHKLPPNHTFFRGNHDNPAKCREYSSYQGDYGFDEAGNFFWLAGAWSIDHAYRIEGVSWWRDEELSYDELDKAVQLHIEKKPEFILSHEAPTRAALHMLGQEMAPHSGASATCVEKDEKYGYYKAKLGCVNTRTSQALQLMLDNYAPKEFVFGHYHLNKSFFIPGYRTKFTCVAELSTYELNTGENRG